MILKVLRMLPDHLRIPLMRKMFQFDVEKTSRARWRFARGYQDHKDAFGVIHRAWEGAGYVKFMPGATEYQYRLGHLMPTSNVLVTAVDGRIVGTFTSVHDSALGLPGEGLYKDVLVSRRRQGRRITEGSALAVDEAFRGHGEVLFSLLRAISLATIDYERCDDAVANMNRLRTDLIRALLLFEPLTPAPLPYPTDPKFEAWPVVNDLHKSEQRGWALFGGRPLHRNLAAYFFTVGRLEADYPERKFFTSMGPRLTPDEYGAIFGGEISLLPTLDDKQRLVLQNAWGPELERLFPELFPIAGVPRRDVRYEADGAGPLVGSDRDLPGGTAQCRLRDVSRRGALVQTTAGLSVGREVTIDVDVGLRGDLRSTVTGRVVREAGAGRYGLKLTRVDAMWDEYLDFLDAWLWNRSAAAAAPSEPVPALARAS